MAERDGIETHFEPTADIIQRFVRVKTYDERIKRNELPTIPLSPSVMGQNPAEMFGLALAAWEAIYDPGEILSLASQLNQIRSGTGPSERTSTILERLHTVREYGIILQSASILFLKKHKSPKSFDTLIRMIGWICDPTAQENPDIDVIETIGATVKEEKYKKKFASANVADSSDFQIAFNDCLAGLEKTSNHNSLQSLEEFHSFRRKQLRPVMNCYRLYAVKTQDPQAIQTFQFLKQIDRRVGHHKDQWRQKNEKMQIIDPRIRDDLQKYRSKIA